MTGSLLALASGCFLLAVSGNQQLFDRVLRRNMLWQRRTRARLPHFGTISPEDVYVRRHRLLLLACGVLLLAIGVIDLIMLAVS